MKVNREILARGGLKLLNEVGLEQMTLRRLGVELKVQPAAIYWHFKSKEELIDEMATMVSPTALQIWSPLASNVSGRRGWPLSEGGFGRRCFDTVMERAWSRVPGSRTRNI